MPATTSNQLGTTSQKENLIDLCVSVGEAFTKFGVLLRDLDLSNRRLSSNNEQDQQLVGWDEQSATMFRQALQTFAASVRDISTAVAEKRIRER